MRTRVVRIDAAAGPWPDLAELGATVRDGGLVAIPTETVYGIAVNLRDEAAVRRLAQARGRADDGPATVHLADADDLVQHVREVPVAARRLAARLWPGPLTLVLSDRHGRPTGFRVPDLAPTRELLRLAGCRVGAVPAHPSGAPPALDAERVLEHFDGVLDAVLDAGACRHGAESTVVRVGPEGDVDVLRAGVVPVAEIREAAARTLLFVCSANRCRSPLAAALATKLLARRCGVNEWELAGAGYRVESAGTACLHGSPPTPEAESVAAERGMDISSHRARPLTPSLVELADEIYVMTRAQRDSILEFAPEARDRVRLLDRRGAEIPDPYGEGPLAYQRTADLLLRALQERLDDL